MKAMIMAGGKGTRLRPLTYAVPKPLLPVGRKPLLEIIIDGLRNSGFTDVILTVEYRSELIKAYFRDGSNFGVKITYVDEEGPSGTAGAVKGIEHLIDNEPFIAMNGDLLTKLDFKKMYDAHISSGAEFTVGVTNYTIKLPYGLIHLQNDKIVSIKEKPDISFCVNAGIYVITPSALDVIPKGEFFDMPDAIQKLIDQGRKVEVYQIDEYWRDIGRMEDYEQANSEISEWT